MHDAMASSKRCIEDNPGLAVFAGVAAGLAVGYALSALVDGGPKRGSGIDHTAADFGRRVMRAVEEYGKAGVQGIREQLTG